MIRTRDRTLDWAVGIKVLAGIVSDESLIDVCLFCATEEEGKALLHVFTQLGHANFETRFSRSKREYRFATIFNEQGEALSVHVSLPPKYGQIRSLAHIQDALAEFRPRFSAMAGICAGDREEVALGDLIVAERAYDYAAGKVVLDEEGRPRLKHDVETWQPAENINQYVRLFDAWKSDVAKLKRPPSHRQQRDWLLIELAEQQTPRVDTIPQECLLINCPDWRRIVDEMKNGKDPFLTYDGTLLDQARVTSLRHGRFRFPYQDPPFARRHIKVMGSGAAVRADNPFPELREPERKLVALDMEGAAFYYAVHNFSELEGRCLLVKGVSDYADPDKDDSYHTYAAEASATYVLHFIRTYVNSELMPRRRPERTRKPRDHWWIIGAVIVSILAGFLVPFGFVISAAVIMAAAMLVSRHANAWPAFQLVKRPRLKWLIVSTALAVIVSGIAKFHSTRITPEQRSSMQTKMTAPSQESRLNFALAGCGKTRLRLSV